MASFYLVEKQDCVTKIERFPAGQLCDNFSLKKKNDFSGLEHTGSMKIQGSIMIFKKEKLKKLVCHPLSFEAAIKTTPYFEN